MSPSHNQFMPIISLQCEELFSSIHRKISLCGGKNICQESNVLSNKSWRTIVMKYYWTIFIKDFCTFDVAIQIDQNKSIQFLLREDITSFASIQRYNTNVASALTPEEQSKWQLVACFAVQVEWACNSLRQLVTRARLIHHNVRRYLDRLEERCHHLVNVRSEERMQPWCFSSEMHVASACDSASRASSGTGTTWPFTFHRRTGAAALIFHFHGYNVFTCFICQIHLDSWWWSSGFWFSSTYHGKFGLPYKRRIHRL